MTDDSDFRILNWLKGANPTFLILMLVVFKPTGHEIHSIPFADVEKVQQAFQAAIEGAKKEGFTINKVELGEEDEKQNILAQVGISGTEESPCMGVIRVQAWGWVVSSQDWH